MPLRIAVIDDNSNILDSISLLLKIEKYFEVVGSFAQVLDCVSDIKPANPM